MRSAGEDKTIREQVAPVSDDSRSEISVSQVSALPHESHRVDDPLKRPGVRVGLSLGYNSDGKKEAAIAQLSRDDSDGLVVIGDFRDVEDRRAERRLTADRRAAESTVAPHSRVALGKGINQRLGGALKIASSISGDTKLDAVGEDDLAVVAAEAAIWRVGHSR